MITSVSKEVIKSAAGEKARQQDILGKSRASEQLARSLIIKKQAGCEEYLDYVSLKWERARHLKFRFGILSIAAFRHRWNNAVSTSCIL